MFVDFLAEMNHIPSKPDRIWVVFTDELSNNKGNRASVILEINSNLVVEVYVGFKFPATNNQVEYEAVIIGIILAGERGS